MRGLAEAVRTARSHISSAAGLPGADQTNVDRLSGMPLPWIDQIGLRKQGNLDSVLMLSTGRIPRIIRISAPTFRVTGMYRDSLHVLEISLGSPKPLVCLNFLASRAWNRGDGLSAGFTLRPPGCRVCIPKQLINNNKMTLAWNVLGLLILRERRAFCRC